MAVGRQFIVSSIGFSDSENHLINMFFGLGRSSIRSYVLSSKDIQDSDILLINKDIPIEVAHDNNSATVVYVTKGPLDNQLYELKRPLAPSRLLKILDEVTIKCLGFSPEVLIGGENEDGYLNHKKKMAEVLSHKNNANSVRDKDKDNALRHKNNTNKGTKDNNLNNAIQKQQKQFPALKSAAQHKKNSIFDHNYAVLVVDDNKTVRQAVGSKVYALNIKTVAVDSGEKALEMAEKYKFNLIFLDIELPEINGYEVCKKLKKDIRTKNIPICMLTGRTSGINKIRGKMSGCDEYLTKPVVLKDLLAVMHRYMPLLSKKGRLG